MMPDRVSILTVSSFDEDHRATEAILRRSKWDHHTARTIAEALRLMRSADVSVILCERDLPDGSWKDLLTAVADPELAPRLILISALADECLWAEALNLGAYDLLAQPFYEPEVRRILFNVCTRDQMKTMAAV